MRRAFAIACLTLVLAACRVDTSVDLTMHPDGTGVVTLTVLADHDVVTQAPGLADDLRHDDATKAGWKVDGLTSTTDGGLRLVMHHDVKSAADATAVLTSINGPNGPLHGVVVDRVVSAQRVTTSLKGTLRVDGGIDAFADPDLLKAIGGTPYADAISAAHLKPTDVVTVTFTAHLPGTSAQASKSLTWTVPIDGTSTDLATTAVLSQGGASSIWSVLATVALVGLVAWVLAAAGFIVFVARTRRARRLHRPPLR
ncbi:MAG: hypothetical protein WCI22_06125 [Actinomycetota bacterium]